MKEVGLDLVRQNSNALKKLNFCHAIARCDEEVGPVDEERKNQFLYSRLLAAMLPMIQHADKNVKIKPSFITSTLY